jgi:hypothetical protein
MAASYKLWLRSKRAHACQAKVVNSSSCGVLDWDKAFRRLYKTTAYLLGKAPLPLWVRLDLVPDGDGFRTTWFWRSQQYVPLQFAVWYPTKKNSTATNQRRKTHALLDAVATVAYEFQHVEYDARGSRP